MVVADGFDIFEDGWERTGIDSGKFSKQLVADFKTVFDTNNAQDLTGLLAQSVKGVEHKGSATFVAARFDTTNENQLKTINLGDSGYLLLRPKPESTVNKFDTLFRTVDQHKKFNYPLLCGTNGDRATKADTFVHQIQDNDIIIMASDGVLDNMYDADLIACVKPQMQRTEFVNPQNAA